MVSDINIKENVGLRAGEGRKMTRWRRDKKKCRLETRKNEEVFSAQRYKRIQAGKRRLCVGAFRFSRASILPPFLGQALSTFSLKRASILRLCQVKIWHAGHWPGREQNEIFNHYADCLQILHGENMLCYPLCAFYNEAEEAGTLHVVS